MASHIYHILLPLTLTILFMYHAEGLRGDEANVSEHQRFLGFLYNTLPSN